AVALARLAAAALDVEAEAAGFVAARPGFGHACKDLANRREQARIGARIGARRAADGTLIDIDDPIDVLQPFDAIARCRIGGRIVALARDEPIERVVHQRRLARARYTRDAGHHAQRDLDGHAFQVVAAGVDDAQVAACLHR